MNTIQVETKKKNYSEARSRKSVRPAVDSHLGEELILEGGSTFVSESGSLGDVAKLANRIRRPNRNYPTNCGDLESKALATDPAFMESFRRGAADLDAGRTVSLEAALKEFGL